MNLLLGEGISKRFKNRLVLDSTNINITKGAAIGIAGSTGSGKSTLLKILAGLVEPDEGAVYYEGKKLEGPLTKLIPGHPKIAYLSQHFELRNNYRVEEIFAYSNQLEESEAQEIFVRCEIDHLLKRRTDELSGGERQRIALARVLVTNPSILLLDEPFSNLDLIQKSSLKNVLSSVTKAFDLTIVLVSHDPADLLPFADKLHIMRDGRIIQSGTTTEIYYHPDDYYIAGLMGQYSLVDEATSNILFPDQYSVQNQFWLRPEMLTIVSENEGRLNGIVESSLFMGAYWQVRVSANGFILLINHNNPLLKKGEVVGITGKKILLN